MKKVYIVSIPTVEDDGEDIIGLFSDEKTAREVCSLYEDFAAVREELIDSFEKQEYYPFFCHIFLNKVRTEIVDYSNKDNFVIRATNCYRKDNNDFVNKVCSEHRSFKKNSGLRCYIFAKDANSAKQKVHEMFLECIAGSGYPHEKWFNFLTKEVYTDIAIITPF